MKRNDISLFKNPVTPQSLGFIPRYTKLGFAQNPQTVTGLQSAAYAFLTILLTPKGSTWNPNRGSMFITRLYNRSIITPTDAMNHFYGEVGDLIQQVNEFRDPEEDPESYLTFVKLDNIYLHYDKVVLRLIFSNKNQNNVSLETSV